MLSTLISEVFAKQDTGLELCSEEDSEERFEKAVLVKKWMDQGWHVKLANVQPVCMNPRPFLGFVKCRFSQNLDVTCCCQVRMREHASRIATLQLRPGLVRALAMLMGSCLREVWRAPQVAPRPHPNQVTPPLGSVLELGCLLKGLGCVWGCNAGAASESMTAMCTAAEDLVSQMSQRVS